MGQGTAKQIRTLQPHDPTHKQISILFISLQCIMYEPRQGN